MWNDCRGDGGKLRVHLLFLGEWFLEIFVCDCIYCTLEGVVMNCILDIDGRNGKSGVEYYLQALDLSPGCR